MWTCVSEPLSRCSSDGRPLSMLNICNDAEWMLKVCDPAYSPRQPSGLTKMMRNSIRHHVHSERNPGRRTGSSIVPLLCPSRMFLWLRCHISSLRPKLRWYDMCLTATFGPVRRRRSHGSFLPCGWT